MRLFFDAKAEKPVINALFIQPSNFCANNCRNCYVRQHHTVGPQVSPHEMAALCHSFYTGELGHCNQITISMDVIPLSTTVGYKWMRNFVEELRQGKFFPGDMIRPEVHMTFRNPPSYREYEKIWDRLAGILTMISFSEIVEGDLPWINSLKNRFPNKLVNYNHMSPAYLTGGSWENHVKWFKQVLQVVDSVYLVVEKRPFGVERDLQDIILDKKRTMSDVNYFTKLRKDLQSNKLVLDGCVQDIVESDKLGYGGCSSGISRFQVWPDGSVSSCQYSIKGDTPPADTAKGIVENIRKARDFYPFKSCNLRSSYLSLNSVR